MATNHIAACDGIRPDQRIGQCIIASLDRDGHQRSMVEEIARGSNWLVRKLLRSFKALSLPV